MAEPHVVVLAAGRGERFGGGKLDAVCAGKPLGCWVLDAVADAGLAPGTLVVGPGSVHFADARPGWNLLVNPHPEQGLGTSLALAARAALARGDRSLLILLADMPLVTPAYLRELAATKPPAATGQPDDHAGVPALLDRALMEKAATLTGDRGAGPLLKAATLLDPPAGMLRDVDTLEDLAEVEAALRK
jgi:CTP:molybdopterin cytidylyltransferase MocA